MIRLSINIDHFATLRNARGENNPDIMKAAKLCKATGLVDSITCHLREDRRHILDKDIYNLTHSKILPLNFEMAPTKEMIDIAIKIQPYSICMVPEKRLELTTEGGLNLQLNFEKVKTAIAILKEKTNAIISLFINPNVESVEISKEIFSDAVEIFVGHYAIANNKLLEFDKIHQDQISLSSKNQEVIFKIKSNCQNELSKIVNATNHSNKLKLLTNAGHGIDYQTAYILARSCILNEISIGHFIVAESLFIGLEQTIINIFDQMKKGFFENTNSQ